MMTSSMLGDALDSIPERWSEEPVIILSDETILELVNNSKGNRLLQTSNTLYYIKDRNPDLLQTIYIRYNKSYEKPPVVRCEALYPDGSTWAISGSAIPRYHVPTYYGYTSNQYYEEIVLPRYSDGMYLKITEKRNYVKPEFFSFEMAGKTMPILNRRIVFTAPAKAAIRYEFSNGESLAVKRTEHRDATRKTFVWSMNNLDKIENIDYYSHPGDWFAALYVSLPPRGLESFTWKQIGDYYLEQIKGAYSDSGNLPKFASSIRTPAPPDSITGDILRLVRDKVRYHGDFDGIHAFIPHSISSIISNGYGDCKDMSILCQSIASMSGVKLGLVLLNAGDGFEVLPSVPTLGSFDHVIVSLKLPDGKVIVADPTVTHGKPLETGFYHVGRRALFLSEGNSHFDTIPRPDDFYNTVTSQSVIRYSEKEKRWELSGTITISGLTAMRLFPDFSELTRQEQTPVLHTYLRNFFELDVQNASFEHLSADTITVHYTTSFQESYVRLVKGGFVLNKPSLYGGDVRFTTIDYSGPRYYREIEQTDTWKLPVRYNDLEMVDLTSDIANGTWAVSGNTISRSFVQNAVRVEDGEAGKVLVQKNKFLNARVWKK